MPSRSIINRTAEEVSKNVQVPPGGGLRYLRALSGYPDQDQFPSAASKPISAIQELLGLAGGLASSGGTSFIHSQASLPEIAVKEFKNVAKDFYREKASELLLQDPEMFQKSLGLIEKSEQVKPNIVYQGQPTEEKKVAQGTFQGARVPEVYGEMAKNQESGSNLGQPNQSQQPSQQSQQPQQNILGMLSNLVSNIYKPMSYDDQGNVQPGSALFGLMGTDPQDLRSAQEAYNLSPRGQTSMAENVPLSRAKREEIELEGSFKTTSPESLKQQTQGETAIRDVISTINAFDKIKSTGPVVGRFAGIGEALTGGSEEVAEFESLANSLVYSLAGYVTGQTGRSISDAELKGLTKTFKFTRNDSDKVFYGKLQAIINNMNNRLAGTSAKILPSARTLFAETRSKRQQMSKSGTPEFRLGQTGTAKDGTKTKWNGKNWVKA